MRLTVLGSSASYAGPGQACAGHFVEAAGARLLFDIGHGVLSNLAQIEDPASLDAVFITHNHPDHYADIYALQALLRYAPDGPQGPLPLYVPNGLYHSMKCLLSERGAAEFDEAFIPVVLEDRVPITFGDATVTPVSVEHTDPTFALVAEAGGVRIAYTADTAAHGPVFDAAKDADLLVAEATLPEEYAGAAPHMTATEAGVLAREAGARALALVHVWPTNDRGLMAELASMAFGRPVVVASELDEFDIAPEGGEDD